MIVLEKNSINTIILSLTENSTLPVPYYLFEFTNELNGNYVLFNATDTSNFNCRYNKFTIIETGTTYQDVTNGIIHLMNQGQWQYNIYEASASTLSISATTGNVLETGIVKVIGTDNSVPNIYQ